MTSTAPAGVDHAHTPAADTHRVFKARRIAWRAFEEHASPADLAAATDGERRALARAAGVTPPSTPETWEAAVLALQELEDWAQDNPDHPKVARRRASLHDEAGSRGPSAASPGPATVMTLVTAGALPRGWDIVAHLPILERDDAVCSRCAAPAVTAVPVVDGPAQWRCPNCPPRPGEWGYALDWTPKDDLRWHVDRPHLCLNPRCPRYELSGRRVNVPAPVRTHRAAAAATQALTPSAQAPRRISDR